MAHTGLRRAGKVVAAGAEALHAHVSELVPLLVAEQGKTLREARLELHKAAETLEHHAGLAKEVSAAYVHGLDPGVDGRVLRKPFGVVARSSRGTSRRRCSPTSSAPRSSPATRSSPSRPTRRRSRRCELAEILTEAGLPPGVLNVVTGTGAGAGEALVTHPLARKVAFTGSTPTGERVMRSPRRAPSG